jgi:phage baseplate assembly protein W
VDAPFGFSFPFRIDPATGGVAKSSGARKLRENLLFLLQSEIGERVLRRGFGAGLRGLVHEPMGSAFFALVKGQIIQAIALYEPRIELSGLEVAPGAGPGEVEVTLAYVVRATQSFESMRATLGPLGTAVAGEGGTP